MHNLYDLFADVTELPFRNLNAACHIVCEITDSPIGADDDLAVLKRRLIAVFDELESPTGQEELLLKLFHLHYWAEMGPVAEDGPDVLRLPWACVRSLISEAMTEIFLLSTGTQHQPIVVRDGKRVLDPQAVEA